MIVVVEGTKSFNDYETFMRAMGVALSNKVLNNNIQVWSLGPHKVNGFTAAFCNSSENFLKQKGYKINFSKVNSFWVEENILHVDYYAYFSLPKEPVSKMVKVAQNVEGCEVGIFRY
jgi:hypothetical protein